MRLFDSHLHLTDAALAPDLDGVLARARDAGVVGMVTVASDPVDAARAISLARTEPDLWSTAGLHPHRADDFDDQTLGRLERLAGETDVVAVGETGLDFHYDHSPRNRQIESFEAQLDLAGRLELPVIVHSRDADAETAELVRRYAGRAHGVLHCFTGGDALLEEALTAGWYVSFAGIVTFGRFDAADRVRRVPDDRLLIETDSPYLAPVPHRGGRNEPSFVARTCAAVAALRDVTPAELAEITTRNAAAFYCIDL